MVSKHLVIAGLCLAAFAAAAPASAQLRYRQPQSVLGSDGNGGTFRYQRLGPNFYGSGVTAGPGYGQGTYNPYGQGRYDGYGRPVYRGTMGGNTTNTTGTQNPWTSRGTYGAEQARQDAARAEAARRAEFARRGLQYPAR